MGGPLIVVPESSVRAWGGCTEDGSVLGDADGRDDYDRACEVEDWAGVIAVGVGAVTALVLADEPAKTCFLPEKLLFVRWLAADSEAAYHMQAISHCREALALQQELEDERGQAGTWDTLGYAYQQIGDYRNAIDCYRHSLEFNRKLGHRYNEAETLVHLGQLHRATGALDAAQDAWQRAIAILTDAGRHDTELDRIHTMLQDLNKSLA
ncbi:hypothetical protein SHL15_9108 [Streptomyces hygroscopicus subsp. limoneus]|nr:hypothetical protein SHL15_9108 [Streptomyces hygroscopicus subsp. limoneus]